MRRLTYLCAFFFAFALAGGETNAGQVESQTNPVAAGSIVIDGSVGDWAGVPCFATDPAGDGGTGYDIAQYCIAHDATNFYVRVGLHGQGSAALGGGAGMWTWFDTDKNFGTGLGVGAPWLPAGLGVEWNGSGVSQFNGWTAGGAHTGSILGGAVSAARSADLLQFEYAIPRSVFGVNSFFTSVQSEVGGGDVSPNGVGNYFEYHASAVLPPVGTYVYETNAALAVAPSSASIFADPNRTKLTDGQANNSNWLNAPTQWVGVQDPAFVPANLAGDNELPQPRVEFVTNSSMPLASVTITYLVDTDAKIAAPDYVVASFSLGGSAYGDEIASFDFDNTADLFHGVAEGEIRTLTIPLGGITADHVRLDFFNDYEWTLLGEVQFQSVPEPSSAMLLVCGGVPAIVVWRRRRAR